MLFFKLFTTGVANNFITNSLPVKCTVLLKVTEFKKRKCAYLLLACHKLWQNTSCKKRLRYSEVSGMVKHMPNGVYRFTSIDELLILVIAKDAEGNGSVLMAQSPTLQVGLRNWLNR